jgi:glycosyltransferase involved in cell wall biosynthesis
LKSARKVILKYGIKNVVTTSPPHSTQLIGLKLKSEFNLNWIADLRDPWTDIHYYKMLYHTPLAVLLDRYYEKKVLTYADKVVVVSNSLRELMSTKFDLAQKDKIFVIPNGYDHEDFINPELVKNDSFIITYTGTIADNYHLENFLRVIGALKTKKIRLRFVGEVSDKYKKMLNQLQLNEKIVMIPHVSHDLAIKYMVTSNLLVLAIPDVEHNNGILTGKLFEYLASGTKIIGIGPEYGDAGQIIAQCNSGKMFDYEDERAMKDFVLAAYEDWKQGTDKLVNISHKQYSRKELTRKIVALLLTKKS